MIVGFIAGKSVKFKSLYIYIYNSHLAWLLVRYSWWDKFKSWTCSSLHVQLYQTKMESLDKTYIRNKVRFNFLISCLNSSYVLVRLYLCAVWTLVILYELYLCTVWTLVILYELYLCTVWSLVMYCLNSSYVLFEL